jgi:hypothetical protein
MLWLGVLLVLIVGWMLLARSRRLQPLSEQEHASID